MGEPSAPKAESLPLAAGLARGVFADASSSLHADVYSSTSKSGQTGDGSVSSHGLLSQGFHYAIDGVASAFGKSDGGAQQSLAWDTSDVLATFTKSVPLFMGRGKGTLMAGALAGLDEVRLDDSLGNQMTDFTLGAGKGVASKTIIDKFAPAEMSLMKKGAIIGGGSTFVDSLLSRHTWSSGNGQLDIVRGLKTVAEQTAMGTIAGSISFPVASALGGKLAPSAERLLGKNLNPAFIASLSNGASFGVTSGLVGETMREVVSGEGLDPAMILKRTALDGLSTMAAAGTGFHLAGGRTFLPAEKNRGKADVAGNENLRSGDASAPQAAQEGYRLYRNSLMTDVGPQALEDLRTFARGEAGKNLKSQMLETARQCEGESGLEFMRDYVYHGNEPQVQDWRLRLFEPAFGSEPELMEGLRPAAQQLIGLTEATTRAQNPASFEQKLSALARNADPDVQSFVVQ
jgi:hypothetical protein